jgi:2-polyprenyl-3-methyl-5-hydroxy-6-metoxy-1,4-benzoquinol methylase
MKWGAYPHPFTQAIVKCVHEIKHQVNPKKLKVIGFGLDARKLFFQFSFIERSEDNVAEILRRCNTGVEVQSIPLDCERVVDALLNECWEPSAEAALLTFCIHEFGQDRMARALRARASEWAKRRMRDEWDYRASRRDVLSVMSVRYPYEQLKAKSAEYVDAVMQFMGSDIRNRDVLEIGCGVGRVSQHIVKIVRRLTCIDLSDRMMTRCRDAVGSQSGSLEYLTMFAQDYQGGKHDVAISSLVLIHNVSDAEFGRVVAKMCKYADVVFVFEDVNQTRPSSPHTRIRSKEELTEAFKRCGFSLERGRPRPYQLLADKIAFLKFVRGPITHGGEEP